MKEQPEALRLADALDECKYVDVYRCKQAAAELRRLHAEVEAQRGTIAQFHHAVAGAGWHPGRTDDLLTDIIRDKGQELRRLHAEVERLSLDSVHTCHSECQRPVCRLTRERDALLEACRFYASMMGRRKSDGEPFYMTALDLDCGDRARAAIAKVEGENHAKNL